MTKKTIHVCAAVIFDGGKVLITSRPPGQEYAGYWEFPGGKIEPGESPAECLKREMREELGMEVMVFDQVYFTEHEYPERVVRLHFIRCLPLDPAAKPEPKEGQEYCWAARCELEKVNFLPADCGIANFLRIFS